MLTFLSFVSALVLLLLAGVVLRLQDRLTRGGVRLFALACVVVGWWHFSLFMYFLSESLLGVSLWMRLAHAGAVWLPALLYHLSIRWSGRNDWPPLITVSYVFSGLLCASVFTPLFFDGYYRYSWGIAMRANTLYHIFLGYAVVYFILFISQSVHWYARARSLVEKNRVRFFTVSCLFIVFAMIDVLPQYGLGIMPPSAFLGATAFALMTGYIMSSVGQLPSLRGFMTRSIAYSILLGVVMSGFAFLTLIVGELLHETLGAGLVAPAILVSIVFVASFEPLKKLIMKTTDHFFHVRRLMLSESLPRLSEIIGKEFDIDSYVSKVCVYLSDALRTGSVHFWHRSSQGFQPLGGLASEGSGVQYVFSLNAPLVRHLEKCNTTVHVRGTGSDDVFLSLEPTAGGHAFSDHCELAVSLFYENQLAAFFLIGGRHSRDVYEQEDIHLLEIIAPQIANGFHKAVLYHEAQMFNDRLQHAVDQATRELARANTALRSADTAKSDFIAIASHHFRTPISSLKGYASMLVQGDFGRIPERARDPIIRILSSAERMAHDVDLFLLVPALVTDASRRQSRFNLRGMIDDAVGRQQGSRMTGNIKVSLVQNLPRFIMVHGNRSLVRSFVNVFVGQAIESTLKGGSIELAAEKTASGWDVTIRDDGAVYDPERRARLIELYGRARGRIAYTEQADLLLYVASRIARKNHIRLRAVVETVGPYRFGLVASFPSDRV